MRASRIRALYLIGAAALTLASVPHVILPVGAEDAKDPQDIEEEAKPRGVMSINLKDAIKANLGIQGQTQGAGTPNSAGIGGFYPLHVSSNGVFFIDALANVSFSDFTSSNQGSFASSIINTTVKGGTLSTSTRLGYRWLNSDRSLMLGVNAGYDSRPMATGKADTGVSVSNSQTVFFQQVAAGFEVVSSTWNTNIYALVPIGNTSQQLNSVYDGNALQTYGLDIGYSVTPGLRASLGYYYQISELSAGKGSGARGRIAYNITNDFVAGVNISYDDAFDVRASIDLKYRLTISKKATATGEETEVSAPVIQALTRAVPNRDIRIRDDCYDDACVLSTDDFENELVDSSPLGEL